MGLRYVWEKWNTVFTYKYRKVSSSVSMSVQGNFTIREELNFNSDTGTFSLGGDTSNVSGYGYLYYRDGYYHSRNRTAINDYTQLYDLDTKYSAQQYIYSAQKGSTSYGNVASDRYTAYPENNYSGSYWYLPLDPDTIDPDNVRYTGEITPGQSVELTITPSSGKLHGGNVVYTIQTTTNGTDWYDDGTTSGRTFTVTIPEDAVIWNVRVYAEDDIGYTSDSYVYGNGIDSWVTVTRSGMQPASGDLGYLTNRNLVAVSVSHADDQLFSLSALLDGAPCFSQAGLPVAEAVMITLQEDVWNGLSETGEHTLVVRADFTDLTEERRYTFKKFSYDQSSLEGVMSGIAKAVRIKRDYDTQILGRNIPVEIVKIDNPVTSEDLASTTAEEAQVFKGYTFISKDRSIKTGTALSQGTSVTAQRLFTGVTAYNNYGQLVTGAPEKTDVTAADIASGKRGYTDTGILLTGSGRKVLAGAIGPGIEYRTYTIFYPNGINTKPKAIVAYFNVWVGSYATSGQQPSFSPYYFRGAASGVLNGHTTAVSGTMRNQNQSSANTTLTIGDSSFSVTFSQYDYVSESEFCYICIW